MRLARRGNVREHEDMNKIVLSYPFLFYSFYRFYLTKRDFAKDWPQGWAVSALSAFSAFFVTAIDYELQRNGIPSISTFFKALPYFKSLYWLLFCVCMGNFIFFFWGKRWQKYVDRYDSLPADVKQLNYWLSGCVVALVFCFLIYQIGNI